MNLPDYWLTLPGYSIDESTRQSFDRLWQTTLQKGENPVINYTLEAPKWQFLSYLADSNGIVFHGSGNSDIMRFEPRQSNDLREFGNQKAVYAASDGIWAMFFAIIARTEVPMSVTNACIRLKAPNGDFQGPFYFFSVSQQVLGLNPWRDGVVYLLPRTTFISQPTMQLGEVEVHIAQLASLVEVKPLAHLPVAPDDFPFLADIRGHDDSRLDESARALETGAPLPEEKCLRIVSVSIFALPKMANQAGSWTSHCGGIEADSSKNTQNARLIPVIRSMSIMAIC